MESNNPYQFRNTSHAVRQHVSLVWGRAGIGSKMVAIIVTLALLFFLIFVAIPLGIIIACSVLAITALRRLTTSVKRFLPTRPPHDQQGRRNVRVIDRHQ